MSLSGSAPWTALREKRVQITPLNTETSFYYCGSRVGGLRKQIVYCYSDFLSRTFTEICLLIKPVDFKVAFLRRSWDIHPEEDAIFVYVKGDVSVRCFFVRSLTLTVSIMLMFVQFHILFLLFCTELQTCTCHVNVNICLMVAFDEVKLLSSITFCPVT